MPLNLPSPLQRSVDRLASAVFAPPVDIAVDFTAPAGEPALVRTDSVTWRIMKNPVALVVGGFSAVILELAEPRVRTGVWRYTSFRSDPATRIKRTGYAAMVTVYAPATAARAMIARVVRAHDFVRGETPDGRQFCANDIELLNWVQTTASYGFVEAYRRFVAPLPQRDADRAYTEAAQAAALYGVVDGPRTAAEVDAWLTAMTPALEASPIITEFLELVRAAPLLPFKPLQALLVRAAVNIVPSPIQHVLGLDHLGLRPGEHSLLRALGALAERIPLRDAPPAQACVRMGLAADALYR